MSDWKTIWDRVLIGQVETDSTSVGLSRVRTLIVQVEHEGGFGEEPNGIYDRVITGQVEYRTGLTHIELRSLIAQVEYEESYPNIPLTRYAPRILVDMYLESGNIHYSTEDLSIEEL
jgi:hypothetical protein